MNLEETNFYNLTDEDLVGYFYVDYELNERVGFFKDKKGNRIDIFIKEAFGNSPHIHLRDHVGNVCRIKLRTNEYQRDAYEHQHKHKLTTYEKCEFDKYMHSQVDKKPYNNWYRISKIWNENWLSANPGKNSGIVDLSKDCPDYINLKEPK